MTLSFREFDAIYRSSLDEVWPYWNETMQTEIARHCYAWGPGRTDFRDYLQLSSVRYFKAYTALASRPESASVCDVGGFWGVWPITLRKLGHEVAMTETLRFYSNSFDELFNAIREHGVQIFDLDPFEPEPQIDVTFDLVTAMAVVEHYPHSLKVFVENLKKLTSSGGHIYFDVPNLAYWPHRVELLKGNSPLAALEDIYRSEVPFIGHHHEMTIAEMRRLAELTDLHIVHEEFYNYSLSGKNPLKLFLRHPVLFTAITLIKDARECIALLCERDPDRR